MTCPTSKEWVRMSMSLLDASGVERMEEHLSLCEKCRAQYLIAQQEHASLMRTYEAFDRDHDKLREQLMGSLPTGAPASVSTRSVLGGWRFKGVLVMTNPTARRATGLVAAIAVLVIAVSILFGSRSSTAFADTLDYLRRVETIVCKVTTTTKLHMELVSREGRESGGDAKIDPARLEEINRQEHVRTETLYLSSERGTRRDVHAGEIVERTTYSSPSGPTLILNRVDRTYRTLDADDSAVVPEEFSKAIAKIKVPEIHFASLPNDPARLIHGLRTLTSGADRELGERIIDGRIAVGYEIAGERVGFGPPWTDGAKENRAEVWVDADSGVPVRLAFYLVHAGAPTRGMPVVVSSAITTVYDEFEWDVVFDEGWLEPTIPDDFTLESEAVTAPVAMPDEAALLTALEVFGELAGRYPTTLTSMNVGYEVATVISLRRAKYLAAKQSGDRDAKEPDMKPYSKLGGLAFFAFLEMADRDPEYFGKEVKPGDSGAILMRWKLDSGELRTIYGDLRTETSPGPE